MPYVLNDGATILPTLKAYTAVSVLALSACIYFATQTIKDPIWMQSQITEAVDNGQNDTENFEAGDLSWGQYVYQVFSVMIREPVSVWMMINMGFCWLIILTKSVQHFVFGDLRVSERQHLKDKFWNYMFYKFIFVFGIVNVQYVDEVLLWCSWFALLGFLHLLCQLGKDRFEYLSFSPTTPVWSHVKLLGLLGCILSLSGFMVLICAFIGFFVGINTFAFMVAEVVLIFLRTLHTIIKYSLHLYDMRNEGSGVSPNDAARVWEKRGPVIYYIELIFEMAALIVDFIHHAHMLLWSNIFLSMASLVICMQLRYLFQEIQERFKRHRNYVLVKNHLETNYPMATPEELSDNSDNCAICWEKMDAARKLPCSHLFHNACLQSWLEQHTSCPTCRMTLSIHTSLSNRPNPPDLQADAMQPMRRQLNFFHFDGSRYVSWLPSFSVEVSRSLRPDGIVANSQLDQNARRVQQLFPHIPIPTIIEDLRVTRSVELTVENIIDERLVVPPRLREEQMEENNSNSLLESLSQTSTTSKGWEDLSENIETEDSASLAGRFSKSPEERERILNKRKEQMRQLARKRYIEKQRSRSQS
ncbi:E3 ubiquitin-protein ligase AMFR-like [Onthophagus taurus]|uniref:E3 ubiquitin-protein ligase AMFR-like n=1 Tax=Onthophagus taurus TaxID=166361 RepID=UPI0039BE0B0C